MWRLMANLRSSRGGLLIWIGIINFLLRLCERLLRITEMQVYISIAEINIPYIYYWVRQLTFFQRVLISWTITLSSWLIWQIIIVILPLNEWLCIRLIAIKAYQLTDDADFGKNNHLFGRSSFWSWRVCK